MEKEMATYSSILAWKIPWTEGPGGLQFTGWQRVRDNLVTNNKKNKNSTSNKSSQARPFWLLRWH